MNWNDFNTGILRSEHPKDFVGKSLTDGRNSGKIKYDSFESINPR